jgi:transcriptional regulator with XRE-family HTH domain
MCHFIITRLLGAVSPELRSWEMKKKWRALTVNDDTTPFGVRLTDLMNERQIDDSEMAERTGRSISTIRTIRRGPKANPTRTTIAGLAKAMSISPDQLHVAEPSDEPAIEVATNAGQADGHVHFDPMRVRAAMRELEKLPVVAAYRDLAASLGL